MPIDAAMAVSGSEWQIAPIEQPGAVEPGAAGAVGTGGGEEAGGFGGMLGDAISSLTRTQTDAAAGAQALASGTVQDPTAVVMAVERAQLAMQLASQVRTKVVEAAQDLFHTQI
jgi:flagellar hook-basal body complex protein FliE